MHTEFLLANLLRIGARSLGDRMWVEQFTSMTTALFWVITQQKELITTTHCSFMVEACNHTCSLSFKLFKPCSNTNKTVN